MADRRYVADDGTVWASKYESQVFDQLRRVLGNAVRKCESGGSDTFPYPSTVRGGRCLECESGSVVQDRSYTPDLHIDISREGDRAGGTYIEAKGYWDAHHRNLLRSAARANPDLNLVFVFASDKWVTKGKSKYTDYVKKYFPNAKAVVWSPVHKLLPGEKRGGLKGFQKFPIDEIL
jgi:hypothetical protein